MAYIDCSKVPRVPDPCVIETHVPSGILRFHPHLFLLHLAHVQRREPLTGYQLQKKLPAEGLLNACVLDFFMDHPHLIPARWKTRSNAKSEMRCIFFWGTLYKHEAGWHAVRFMYYYDHVWREGFRHLNGLWYRNNPALMLVPGY